MQAAPLESEKPTVFARMDLYPKEPEDIHMIRDL
jgi:hypothetical protein